MKDVDDPIAFVREVVRGLLFGVMYHEKELIKARAALGFAKEMSRRGGFKEDVPAHEVEDGDSYEDGCVNVEEWVSGILAERLSNVEYHEEQMEEDYQKLAFAKMMLARGNYTEIDVAEIQNAVLKSFEEKRDAS